MRQGQAVRGQRLSGDPSSFPHNTLHVDTARAQKVMLFYGLSSLKELWAAQNIEKNLGVLHHLLYNLTLFLFSKITFRSF